MSTGTDIDLRTCDHAAMNKYAAEKVMGWSQTRDRHAAWTLGLTTTMDEAYPEPIWEFGNYKIRRFTPATDANHALELLEKVEWAANSESGAAWICVGTENYANSEGVLAPTLPEAITRAVCLLHQAGKLDPPDG